MTTLTVRNVDDDVLQALHARATANGRSVEAEHREILRDVLLAAREPPPRATTAARLAAFRGLTAGRGSAPAADLLRESRDAVSTPPAT